MKNKALIILLISLITSNVIGQSLFQFSEIPWGKSLTDVTKMISDDEYYIRTDDNVEIYCIGRYEISNYFEGGLYSTYNISVQLNGKITKHICLTPKGESNIKEINLYFVCSNVENSDKSSYTLFLLHKSQKTDSGTYKNIFFNAKNKIKGILGKEPNNTKYLKYNDRGNIFNGIVGFWNENTKRIILMVSGGDLFTAGDGRYVKDLEMLYVDKQGWRKYTNCVKVLEQLKAQEQIKNNQIEF